jgi:hypothetical protein
VLIVTAWWHAIKRGNRQRGILRVLLWFCVIVVVCRAMPIEMPVWLSAGVWWHALKNHSRKSLQLLYLV